MRNTLIHYKPVVYHVFVLLFLEVLVSNDDGTWHQSRKEPESLSLLVRRAQSTSRHQFGRENIGKKDGTKGEECLGVNTSGCFVRECKLDNNAFHCSELIFNHFKGINTSYSPTYYEGAN